MLLTDILKFICRHPLNKGQPVTAISRFIAWQLRSRMTERTVFDWINGSKLLVKRSEYGLTGNIYTGLMEFEDMAFLLHVLRAQDLFVDVGANLGSYSILAGAAVGARGIAFEPVPQAFARLTENMHVNGLDAKVACVAKAIGNSHGSIRFTASFDAMNHVADDGDIEVEVSTLDTELRRERPFLMKIDVEGYETSVVDGASETLGSPTLQGVIMELNGAADRYGFDENVLLERMLGFGFRTYSYDPFRRHLEELRGKNPASGNTLFLRDVPLVMDRVRSAASVRVHGITF